MKQLKPLIISMFILLSCTKDTTAYDNSLEKGEFLNDWTYNVFMYDNYKTTFRLWVPKNITPRAILVLIPGNYSNGINMIDDVHWQQYAKKERIALLGAHIFANSQEGANNLLIAINKISEARKLNYLSQLPLLFRGHSSGGRFSYDFSTIYRNKVLAFANIKGSINEIDFKLPPNLLIYGENDQESRNQSIKNAFYSQRSLKGISCLAKDKNGAHGIGNSDSLIKSFFTSILKKASTTNYDLINLQEDKVLLGDNHSLNYSSFYDFNEVKKSASCLIDSNFADEWVTFNQ